MISVFAIQLFCGINLTSVVFVYVALWLLGARVLLHLLPLLILHFQHAASLIDYHYITFAAPPEVNITITMTKRKAKAALRSRSSGNAKKTQHMDGSGTSANPKGYSGRLGEKPASAAAVPPLLGC